MTNIGIIGLGTMGYSLYLHLREDGLDCVPYSYNPEELKKVDGHCPESLNTFINSLATPRRVLLMITAGEAVDEVLNDLVAYLDAGDTIIDGGNSHYIDSERRISRLANETGIHYICCGISGAAEGARNGAALMPSGATAVLNSCEDVFQSLAAIHDGQRCYACMGGGAAGHFVKMVHNGIEYALMQLIAEVYGLLHTGYNWNRAEIRSFFGQLAGSPSRSYLLEITNDILDTTSAEGELVLDGISDRAAQKGTGRFASDAAMELGVAIPSINAAVTERYLSQNIRGIAPDALEKTSHALPSSTIMEAYNTLALVIYAQGIELIRAGSAKHNWQIPVPEVVRVWQGGCIIRAHVLTEIQHKLHLNKGAHLIEIFKDSFNFHQCQQISANMMMAAVPSPVTAATANYLLSLSSRELPTNLVQAQRDYFGDHGFERKGAAGQYHAEWVRQ